MRLAIYLEIGSRRTFASAAEWPGWARSGRTEADALDALLAYAPRYEKVVGARAGFTVPDDVGSLDVVGRLRGNATTDFGAPGAIPPADADRLSGSELDRQVRLLRSAWRALDRTAEAVRGRRLRTGPRGGGRTLPKILEHVFDAETAYLRSLGARYRGPAYDHGALRDAAEATLRSISAGEPVENPTSVRRPWPVRYFVRRAAWHVLDHAWEAEDRAEPDA